MSQAEEAETHVEEAQAPTTEPVEVDMDDESGDDMFEGNPDDFKFEDTDEDDEPESEVEEETDQSDDAEDESEEADETEDSNESDESEEEPEIENKEEDTASDEQETEKDTSKTEKELAHEAFKLREEKRRLREQQEQRERQDLELYLQAAQNDESEFLKRQNEVAKHLLTKERSAVLQDKVDVQLQRIKNDFLQGADDHTINFVGRQLDKFEQANMRRDQNGNLLGINGDVYQYIKEEMDSIGQFRSIGAREQKQSKVKEKSRTIPKPTRTPKEPQKDPWMTGWDEDDEQPRETSKKGLI